MTVPATTAFAVNSVNGWDIVNPLTYAPEKDECHLMKIDNLIDYFKFCFLNKAGCGRRPGFVMSFNEDSLLEEEQFTSISHPESNRFIDFVDVMNIMLDSSKRLDDRLGTLKTTLKTRKDHADRLESRGPTVIEGSECAICQLEYTTSGNHVASSLPCGHIFGKKCIYNLQSSEIENGRVGHQCPICRATYNSCEPGAIRRVLLGSKSNN
ncbi:hypothetical protein ElyMa_004523300 [Elysia marginata]|uniref:RING-type domain-containing protein n=1 Tax=Elysia marginata TaxID=1093978 RepID=A0AAV4HNG0_9GAST|nr:hypothetical protein ElyMa_004523300 [Elysia marginata]